jgi:hypothetical protein
LRKRTASETLDAAFDEHLLVCDECWGIVEATEAYVRAIWEAAQQLNPLGL